MTLAAALGCPAGFGAAPRAACAAPTPEVPETDLPLLQLIGRLRTNGIAAWPKRAYEEMFVHRRCLGTDAYLVNDPEAARRVLLADVDAYERPLGFRRLYRPIFGGGLLLAEGEAWREQRRRLAPAFTARHVETLIPRFRAVGERVARRLQEARRANLSRMFQEAAIDAVGTAAFSMPLDPLSNRIASFRADYFRCGAKVSVFDHLATRETDFLLHYGERGRHGRRGRAIVRDLIAARREAPPAAQGSPDVVDLLLAARGNDGSPLPDETVCDEVATMLGTGFDTTGRCLFWASYLLAQHPTAQASIREELRRFSPRRVETLADLDAWPLLRACLFETLRLYPPLQTMVRVPLRPVTICGRAVAKGSYVSISPWVMHRHRRLWDRPDDFHPERFLEDGRAALHRPGFIPFGAGRRTCIGAAFAVTEITLVLATLLENHEISLADERPVIPVSVVTTAPDFEPTFLVRPIP